jgi:uncharacterized protein
LIPDVNILVAASRSDHPHYNAARSWVRDALAACATGSTFRLLPFVALSYLRLVTNPKIFVRPTPIKDAMEFLDAILEVPGTDMPAVGAEWPLLRQLCLQRELRGNSLPDAWLAAAVVLLGEHLVTFDADFKALLHPSTLTVLAT